MDVALLNLLEDRSPTAAPSMTGAARRLRDLWLAGMPLERAAPAAGLTVSEAEDRLTGLGYAPIPEPPTFDVEALRRLYRWSGSTSTGDWASRRSQPASTCRRRRSGPASPTTPSRSVRRAGPPAGHPRRANRGTGRRAGPTGSRNGDPSVSVAAPAGRTPAASFVPPA